MSDLNLNFDNDKKNIIMSNTSGSSNNLGFSLDTNNIKETVQQSSSPNLNVSDSMGVNLLMGNSNMSPKSDGGKSDQSTKSEEFTFFKPPEDTGGIINGDLKNTNIGKDEAIFMNNENKETSGYKPIHTLTPQDIKNEKIDLIYKFKKLEQQGIRTTINYNMNSHLDDMRNEYIKLKKQREIDNSIKFQRKMLMACVTGLEFMNGRFDPFNVKLDGWSESVNENLKRSPYQNTLKIRN